MEQLTTGAERVTAKPTPVKKNANKRDNVVLNFFD